MYRSLIPLVLVGQVGHSHAVSSVLFRDIDDAAAIIASLAHAAAFGTHLPSAILVLE